MKACERKNREIVKERERERERERESERERERESESEREREERVRARARARQSERGRERERERDFPVRAVQLAVYADSLTHQQNCTQDHISTKYRANGILLFSKESGFRHFLTQHDPTHDT